MEISNSEFNESYTTKIDKTFASDTHCLNEEGWIQFLKDHRDLLKEHSEFVILDEKVMYTFRYRIRDYLRGLGRRRGMEQAFKICNRIYSDQDFDLHLTSVYVPTNEYVNELRQRYNTNKAIARRLDSVE